MIDYLENLELKKGDKVKCVLSSEKDDFKKGEVYKVIKNKGYKGVINDIGYFMNTSYSEFKILKKKENAKSPWKFKVGDLLQCVTEAEGFTKGDVYKLCGTDDQLVGRRFLLINDFNIAIGSTDAEFKIF